MSSLGDKNVADKFARHTQNLFELIDKQRKEHLKFRSFIEGLRHEHEMRCLKRDCQVCQVFSQIEEWKPI